MIIERHNNGETEKLPDAGMGAKTGYPELSEAGRMQKRFFIESHLHWGWNYPIFSQILARRVIRRDPKAGPAQDGRKLCTYTCLRNKKNTFMELDQVMDSYDRHRGRKTTIQGLPWQRYII